MTRRSFPKITTSRIKVTRKRRRISVQEEEYRYKDKMIVIRIGKVISTRKIDEEKKITRR